MDRGLSGFTIIFLNACFTYNYAKTQIGPICEEEGIAVSLRENQQSKSMITKQFLKSKSLCKVTFTLPKEAVEAATEVAVMGEFNNWDLENPVSMKKQKDGSFKTTLELETGKEYAFRYLLDGVKWENDNAADKYVATPFGSENSVVIAMN